MKKIFALLVTAAIVFAPVAAYAGSNDPGGQWRKHGHNNGNNNWKHGNGYKKKHGHNNWQNGNNNYYHGGNKYYYGGNGGYDYFYQDPGFWGGVVGGIVGGAIANDNYGYAPAPMAPQCIVQPYKVWDDYQGWVIQYRQLCN